MNLQNTLLKTIKFKIMAKTYVPKNFKVLSIRFQENWNKKLYGKYFTTIRKHDYCLNKGDIVDVVFKGKAVASAKVIECDLLFFHELGHVMVMCDTGYNYADSLELFYKFGINVKSFETKVKVYLLENLYFYQKKE